MKVLKPASLLLLLLAGGTVKAQTFSLDDLPAAPLTTPPLAAPFGFGTEDPYGGALPFPFVGPSPSMVATFPAPAIDGDLLNASPVPSPIFPELDTAAPFEPFTATPMKYLDAVSNNGTPPAFSGTINILFSVDRLAVGAAGTAVATEATLSQQPGDIYVSCLSFPHPGTLAGTLPPAGPYVGLLLPPAFGAPNSLLIDESALELTPGLGPGGLIPPGVPAPAIAPGTHDNVDAFERVDIDTTGDLVEDVTYYHSINPDEAIDKPPFLGLSSADIFIVPVGSSTSALFAPAGAMGLDTVAGAVSDDVNGLVIWDLGTPGVLDPGVDFALFSLAPGSASLATFGLDQGDVFFTDFTGAFGTFALAIDLGLIGSGGGGGGAVGAADNIDALEVILTGDANFDGSVDPLDFSIIAGSFGGAGTWMTGDFDCDGVVGPLDFSIFVGQFGLVTGS